MRGHAYCYGKKNYQHPKRLAAMNSNPQDNTQPGQESSTDKGHDSQEFELKIRQHAIEVSRKAAGLAENSTNTGNQEPSNQTASAQGDPESPHAANQQPDEDH
jgi:hypothetical protein